MIALFSETSYLVAKMIVMMTILPQMLPISSQSLNGTNLASRRAREVYEKENHQNLTSKIMSIKSRTSLTVWSQESSNLYPK